MANTGRVILEGVVGSTAYNLAGPDSDEDRLGVFVRPLRQVLAVGYGGPVHDSWVQTKPDVTWHEIGKFCKLALSANPTVLELLYLEKYTTLTSDGEELLRLREAFLSNRVRKTYGGYATQQVRRLRERGGTFDPDLKKRTEKHGRHCYRLLLQGRELLETGKIRIRLTESERERCFEVGRLAETDIDEFSRIFEKAIAGMDSTTSCLHDEPNTEVVDEYLYNLRLSEVR